MMKYILDEFVQENKSQDSILFCFWYKLCGAFIGLGREIRGGLAKFLFGKQLDISVPKGLVSDSVFQMVPSLFQPITSQYFKVPSENRTPSSDPPTFL